MRSGCRTADDVLKALQLELGSPPREDIWDELLLDNYVDEVIEDREAFTSLLDRYKTQCARYPTQRQAGRVTTEYKEAPPDERNRFLATLVALEAAKDAEVVAFRQGELGGRLLEPGEIEPWVRAQAEGTGQPAQHLKMLQRHGRALAHELVDGAGSLANELFERYYTPILWYDVPDSNWRRGVVVTSGTTLHRLLGITLRLAEKYAWFQGQATTFVLAGFTPELPKATLTFSWRAEHPALSRITMTFSPMLSPEEVAKIYGEARGKRLGLQTTRQRYRPLSAKHLTLAVFAAARSGEKWREIMAAWNGTHPEWAYRSDQLTNFARDAARARVRLLGRE